MSKSITANEVRAALRRSADSLMAARFSGSATQQLSWAAAHAVIGAMGLETEIGVRVEAFGVTVYSLSSAHGAASAHFMDAILGYFAAVELDAHQACTLIAILFRAEHEVEMVHLPNGGIEYRVDGKFRGPEGAHELGMAYTPDALIDYMLFGLDASEAKPATGADVERLASEVEALAAR